MSSLSTKVLIGGAVALNGAWVFKLNGDCAATDIALHMLPCHRVAHESITSSSDVDFDGVQDYLVEWHAALKGRHLQAPYVWLPSCKGLRAVLIADAADIVKRANKQGFKDAVDPSNRAVNDALRCLAGVTEIVE